MDQSSSETVMRTEIEALVDLSASSDSGRELISWRLAQLVRAGYREDDAVALALSGGVDLHRAVALAAAGCPSETAVRILL